MKNYLIIIFSIIIISVLSIILLSSHFFSKKTCEELDLADGISLSIKDGTLSKTGATIIITSNSDNKYQTGRDYRIDKFTNGNWNKLKLNNEMVVVSDAINIENDNPLEFVINWERYYGTLDKGKYRIVKNVSKKVEPFSDKQITIEFSINN